jgi:YebC/PmpR family DNA-binding regulatory protein
MSGHSKWANIKRKKAANDKVKGNVFGKMSRIITLAVIEGGGMADPDNNVKLRIAIEKAKSFNMPKENIKRAIERGSGPDKANIKEIIYEGFGPGGVAMLMQATTDNPNRTLGEIRSIMDRHEGKLGNSGSVGYLFKKCALMTFKKDSIKEEEVWEVGDKLGAFDIQDDQERFYVYFPFENLGHIKDKLEGVIYESAEVDFKPQTIIEVDSEKLAKVENLASLLEDLDDVHKVFVNL